jgi:zinc transporter, ZIP family
VRSRPGKSRVWSLVVGGSTPVDEAFALGGAARSGLGLLAGAAVFVALDAALDRHVGHQDAARSGVGWVLLAAVTLDGIPENLALGTSLVEGTSPALLVAIFFSSLPEMPEAFDSGGPSWRSRRRPASSSRFVLAA